jgi:uncharacterized repeat protein (TIGR03803 family)
MKTSIKNLFLLPAVIAGLGLIPAGSVTAQTLTTLHSFTNGSDGSEPVAGLILSGQTLYGTTQYGSTNSEGMVFSISINGSNFTTLHAFGYNDGENPQAGLILSGNTLYGTTRYGGTNGADNGTVFSINTNGSGYTILHSFATYSGPDATNYDGSDLQAGLILSGNTLYGTASEGGGNDVGTVFSLNTDGSAFTVLHTFSQPNPDSGTNSDGQQPRAGLCLSGNTLYGTAWAGGSDGSGTVFSLYTNGMDFTNLHNFEGGYGSNATSPLAGVIVSGNTLYGTASYGGSGDEGTVFSLNTDGSAYTNLCDFSLPYYPYVGPANPVAGLILSGQTLYGTSVNGGTADDGTVFAVSTNGADLTNLYSFTTVGYAGHNEFTNSDGANPAAGLILSGNTFYGTTQDGGTAGYGTVFSLSLASATVLAPQLDILLSGANVILTWTNTAAGFTLQSTANLASPVVWSANSPAPVVLNGQYTVTNSISGTHQFYRLSQ